MNDLANPIFADEAKAREWLEAQVWPDGPYCPHCGSMEEWTRLEGEAHRPGLLQCNACRQQFTVTVGTVFERSKIALTKWLMALYLLSASKKGMSTKQLSRMLGLPYKTAWFMTHRLREAMKSGGFDPLGGEGKTVEVDETYIGSKGKRPKTFTNGVGWERFGGPSNKRAIVALVERGGRVISFHVPSVSSKAIRPLVMQNVDRASRLNTDDASQYVKMGREFKGGHAAVNHSEGEYVRGKDHTNTIEGVFSIFKRGMIGTYQHCGEQHLQRYVTEFDFRYSNRKISDMERAQILAKGISGKRLTYRRVDKRTNEQAGA